MQETRPRELTPEQAEFFNEVQREFFEADTDKGVNALMDERLKQLEGRGRTLHRRVKIGRNDMCLCGSGRKYKRCCIYLVHHGRPGA